jgi:regulatory Fis family protein
MSDCRDQSFRVYSVVPRQDNGEDRVSIGLARPHEDGQGFDVMLQALPLNSRLVMRSDGQRALPSGGRETARERSKEDGLLSLKRRLEDFERALIEQCLLECGGRISAVTERLDIPRRTLSEKIARLGIDRARLMAANADAMTDDIGERPRHRRSTDAKPRRPADRVAQPSSTGRS